MLHLVFYARIASELKAFDITDVLNSICDKLIERHPHVYGDVVANDEANGKEQLGKDQIKNGKQIGVGRCAKNTTCIGESYPNSGQGTRRGI